MLQDLDAEGLRQLRHDLRSPLLIISGFAQLLGGDRAISDEERRQFAERIERATDELKKILDEIIGV
jgi:signal transduction histidine kinase